MPSERHTRKVQPMAHVIKEYETDKIISLANELLRTDISAVECSCNRRFESVAEWSHHATEQQQIHIEGLQVTLRNRKQRIRQLEEQVANSGNTRESLDHAYRRGWVAAMARIRKAAQGTGTEGEEL